MRSFDILMGVRPNTKRTMNLSPSTALRALKEARRAALHASAVIDTGLQFQDARAVREGVRHLVAAVSDASRILEDLEPRIYTGSGSRTRNAKKG